MLLPVLRIEHTMKIFGIIHQETRSPFDLLKHDVGIGGRRSGKEWVASVAFYRPHRSKKRQLLCFVVGCLVWFLTSTLLVSFPCNVAIRLASLEVAPANFIQDFKLPTNVSIKHNVGAMHQTRNLTLYDAKFVWSHCENQSSTQNGGQCTTGRSDGTCTETKVKDDTVT